MQLRSAPVSINACSWEQELHSLSLSHTLLEEDGEVFLRLSWFYMRTWKVKGKSISFPKYSEISLSEVTLKGDIR